MCMSVCPACISMRLFVYWCPQRTEKGLRSPGAGVTCVVSCHVTAGNQTGSSGKQAVSLLTTETFISPALQGLSFNVVYAIKKLKRQKAQLRIQSGRRRNQSYKKCLITFRNLASAAQLSGSSINLPDDLFSAWVSQWKETTNSYELFSESLHT